jgi:hypothetical protein
MHTVLIYSCRFPLELLACTLNLQASSYVNSCKSVRRSALSELTFNLPKASALLVWCCSFLSEKYMYMCRYVGVQLTKTKYHVCTVHSCTTYCMPHYFNLEPWDECEVVFVYRTHFMMCICLSVYMYLFRWTISGRIREFIFQFHWVISEISLNNSMWWVVYQGIM